ncbi:amidohydrolase [Murinocardiopsis flavida]|uniref:amidohydrolase n=1 Tax=Murinocardiopsis flavida TaxID=645275 RepID=UPI000D0D7602|nr:amidohydrolase [Murinocardiopsis flavida]
MDAVPHAVDPQRVADHGSAVMRLVEEIFPLVEGFYVDLHKNPELSHQEKRTAKAVAEWLSRAGYEVETGIGSTGVVGVLRNGEGPTVLLRADMDALPMAEKTGLPYASTAHAVGPDGAEVPIMHACGHDAHTACLVGVADLLSESRDHWSGTLMIVAQPAEETVDGASGMLADGLYERFGRPDIALAQHLGPQPAGMVAHRAGVMMAASTTLHVRVFGTGGHASQPDTTVDPVVLGANIVTRLQTVVSRETSPSEMAVVTVGRFQAGSAANIIPDEAYLEINTRALNDHVAGRLHAAIERIVRAEAAASGAPREPEVTVVQQTGITRNSPPDTRSVASAHRAYFGDGYVVDLPEPFSGSEDFGEFGLPGDPNPVPYVFWFVGATPHDVWEAAPGATPYEKLAGVPSNHSPFFAPDREPTLRAGLGALTIAALTYLGAAANAAAETRQAEPAAFEPVLPAADTGGYPSEAQHPAPAAPAAVPAAEDPAEDEVESTQDADMAVLLAEEDDDDSGPRPGGGYAGYGGQWDSGAAAPGGRPGWDSGADPAAEPGGPFPEPSDDAGYDLAPPPYSQGGGYPAGPPQGSPVSAPPPPGPDDPPYRL